MFYHHFLPHLSATIGIIHLWTTNVNCFFEKICDFFLKDATKIIMIPT